MRYTIRERGLKGGVYSCKAVTFLASLLSRQHYFIIQSTLILTEK